MELKQKDGVYFYHSELLPCPHGFSTRIGGVSSLEHTKTLNLAYGRGDDKEIVLENLCRFANAVGVEPESIISLPQVHGTSILSVTHTDRGEGYIRETDRTADGYYTGECGVTLGVKTADCVPILLCAVDEWGSAVAVAALHAGWRGTVGGIARRGVETLRKKGILVDQIRAAIGPAIGPCCYEVDQAFYLAFSSALGEELVSGTFQSDDAGHYTADLKEINRRILVEAGVLSKNIDVSRECTACRPELFFSHRYSRGIRGTMLSIIALPHVDTDCAK